MTLNAKMRRDRLTYKQMLVVVIWALLVFYPIWAAETFVQLVIDYGFWDVVSKPIYPVSTKPDMVLSNGDVWTTGKYTVNFAITVALWLVGLNLTKPLMRKWTGRTGFPFYDDRPQNNS